jgi:hypothetical protein
LPWSPVFSILLHHESMRDINISFFIFCICTIIAAFVHGYYYSYPNEMRLSVSFFIVSICCLPVVFFVYSAYIFFNLGYICLGWYKSFEIILVVFLCRLLVLSYSTCCYS